MLAPTRRPLRTRALALLLVASTTLASGCGLLMNRTQKVSVSCTQPDAALEIDGKRAVLGLVELKTGFDHELTISAPGRIPQTIKVLGHGAANARVIALDCVWILAFGAGLVFLLVDLGSGCAFNFDPPMVHANLQPDPGAGATATADREPAAPAPAPAANPLAAGPRPTPPRPRPASNPLAAGKPWRLHVVAIANDPRAEDVAARVAARVGPSDKVTGRATLAPAATRKAALGVLRDLLEDPDHGKDDRALVFLAAPGFTDANGEAWLLLADADPAAPEDTALAASTVASYLERSGIGAATVVVAATPVAGRAPFDASKVGPAGTLRAGLSAPDAPARLGEALVRGLAPSAAGALAADQDGDGAVSAAELGAWLQAAGATVTAPTPGGPAALGP